MNVPSVEVIPYTEQYSLTLLKSVIEDPQTHFDNVIILHYIKGYPHKFEFGVRKKQQQYLEFVFCFILPHNFVVLYHAALKLN